MSYATAVLIIAKFGLDLAASRLASEYGVASPEKLRPLFLTGLGLRSVFTLSVAILSLVFAAPIAAFFHDPDLQNPIRIGALIVVCASLYEFNENFLVGLNRLAIVYRIRTLHLLTRVGLTLILVILGFGAVPILGGYCVAWLVAILVCSGLLLRYLPTGEGEATGVELGRLMALSATLALSAASVTIYSHMDRLMLGYFSGVEEVGQFAVARNITEVSLFPVFAMVMMLRPALASRFSTGQTEESAQIIRRSLRFSFLSGVLFAALFVALGRDLVVFVFSDVYQPAGRLMALFAGVIVLRSVGAIILPALIAAEQARLYAYLTLGSAILNFVLNAILIPRYASQGAIIATLISYGALLVVGMTTMLAKFRIAIDLSALSVALRTILAGVIASGVTWWLADHTKGPSWYSIGWAVLLTTMYLVLIYALRLGSFSNLSELFTNLRKQKR